MTSHMCGVWTIPWACVLILRAWTIPFCLHMAHTTSSQHHVLGRHHSPGQPCPCHTWCNNGAGAKRKFAVAVMLTTTTFLIFVVTCLHFGFYNCVQTQTNILIGKYKITQNWENQQQLYYITVVVIAQSRCCCVWRECCWLRPLIWVCCCGPDSGVVAEWRAGGAVATAKCPKVTRRQQQSWARRPVLLEGLCCCPRVVSRVTWRAEQWRKVAHPAWPRPGQASPAHSTFDIPCPRWLSHYSRPNNANGSGEGESMGHTKFMPHTYHVGNLEYFIKRNFLNFPHGCYNLLG